MTSLLTNHNTTMKTSMKQLATPLLALGALLFSLSLGQSQITVKVDSTKSWQGYMNWFSTNNAYAGGGAWGAVDLRARFAPAQVGATRVILNINTNTYAPGTATPPDTNFWNFEDGTPNKHLEANFYVDVGTSFGGNDVIFEGTVESNTLPAGWTCEAVIKQFGSGYSYVGDTRAALVTGSPFSVMRNIPSGNICQYGFLLYGPNTAPDSAAALEGVSVLVDNADPAITGEPTDQRVAFGDTAHFTVTATGSAALSYQWIRYGTNLANGGTISGANSATLTINNAQANDATTYTVAVTNTANLMGVVSLPAQLRVMTPTQLANLVNNPSFEEGVDVNNPQLVPPPWNNFSGSMLFGDLGFVTPYDGTNMIQVNNLGQYNGVYQDIPAVPGQIFTGDCYLFQSSFDPLTAPINEAFMEVQFWAAGGAGPIAMYQSLLVTNDPSMIDAWLHLEATNGVAAGYASTSTSDAKYLVAPEGTTRVRVQITTHAEGGGTGSVFVDAMRLLEKIPVSVTATLVGGNINLSWPTQVATDYQVVYKDNLTDASWTPVGAVIPGDGTVKATSFPTSGNGRYYSVLTL